jgi:hypothetical protein
MKSKEYEAIFIEPELAVDVLYGMSSRILYILIFNLSYLCTYEHLIFRMQVVPSQMPKIIQ